MIAVVKGTGATVANRALQLIVQSPMGLLTDVYAASFQIFDTTTAQREAEPVQLFPTTEGEKQSIDLITQRLSTGRYGAVWDSSSSPLGRHVVRWFYQLTSTSTELSFDQEFEVVPFGYLGPYYCSVYDMVAAGWTDSTSDGRLQKLIVQASRYIEHYTGRTFYPLYKVLTLSAGSGRMLMLDEPIIALEGFVVDYTGEFAVVDRQVGTFRVFNRHLTQNLFAPDDRENPKLEFLHGSELLAGYAESYYSRFGIGVQNVQVAGIFGYTEPDGSMTGCTPNLIRLACQLLVFNNRHAPGSAARREEREDQLIKSEYTRDQGFIYHNPREVLALPPTTHTGDVEIDSILSGFRRPSRFGAA